ncbi:hypothetical protein GA0074692_4662 [Micromonospora pallida]|uniref:Uncharacterized protein n=1 Tax=Micromonospora pallida TaxID=145854 RepID=A0A1C6T6I4_9ACTN|nr:hypothetical protein GA0074692_4662 [Micromonospora pallida]
MVPTTATPVGPGLFPPAAPTPGLIDYVSRATAAG